MQNLDVEVEVELKKTKTNRNPVIETYLSSYRRLFYPAMTKIFLFLSLIIFSSIAPISAASQTDLVTWGEKLFSEEKLSENGKVSCETCHDPNKAFTDGKKTGVDIEGKPLHRNSPSLVNVAELDPLTWANPVLRSVEQQILVPLFLDTPGEMGLSKVWPKVKHELQSGSPHRELFKKAFPDAKELEAHHVVSALASFMRSIVQRKTAYDLFLEGNLDALDKSAEEGRQLFFSDRTHCADCHRGNLFTRASRLQKLSDPLSKRRLPGPYPEVDLNAPFANTGLYRYPSLSSLPSHALGLYEFTQKPEDLGSFRIPSLRNLRLTAPYMHDGSLATLEEVTDHYNQGGKNQCFTQVAKLPDNCNLTGKKSPLIRPLALSQREKNALIAFLKTL